MNMHRIHMQTAFLHASASHCCSWKVGAVIVKDGRPVAAGRNGTAQGKCNCDQVAKKNDWLLRDGTLNPAKRHEHSAWSAENEIHAEINAILFAARNGIAIEGADLYCTASPCPDCCKAISNSGIARVFYCIPYDRGSDTWKQRLAGAGIEVIQIPKEELTMIKLG